MKLDSLVVGFKRPGCRISWVKAKNMHLTLKFIGEYDPDRLEFLTETVTEHIKEIKSNRLDLAGLGAFPNMRHPRVLWVGVQRNKEWFVDLAGRVDTACARLKIPKEKRIPSPHLTIGRVRGIDGCEAVLEAFSRAAFEYQAFDVNSITLYRSDLKPQGAEYTVLKKISL